MHGLALQLAQHATLEPLLNRLTTMAGDQPDLRARVAGDLAGRWFASPADHTGYDLIAAGLSILAGPIDRRDVARWLRAAYAHESVGTPALKAIAVPSTQAIQGDALDPRARLLSASALLLATRRCNRCWN